jgi:TolA-binding protein
MKRVILVVMSLLAFQAFADLEEEAQENRAPAQRPQRQAPAPKEPPPQVFQQDDLFEQMRTLSGRLDNVENQLSQINAAYGAQKDGTTKDRQALEQKFVAYEEALKKLEAQIQAMSDDLKQLRTAPASAPSRTEKAEKAGKPEGKSPSKAYEDGESLFKDKKYREAILAYEKYRGSNPKGKFYADSTFKMGVCFQEVGLKDEAKIFFDEVISKFPGSKEAKKAAARAKQLK